MHVVFYGISMNNVTVKYCKHIKKKFNKVLYWIVLNSLKVKKIKQKCNFQSFF